MSSTDPGHGGRPPSGDVRIRTARPAEIARLIARLDAHLSALYPPASTHFLDLEQLADPAITVLAAEDGDGVPIGCGAYRRRPGYGEVKRMYVEPGWRGRGLGTALLRRIEELARAEGAGCLRLETGVAQPEAIALYQRCGFARSGPFGEYPDDPLCVFMVKWLAPPA